MIYELWYKTHYTKLFYFVPNILPSCTILGPLDSPINQKWKFSNTNFGLYSCSRIFFGSALLY